MRNFGDTNEVKIMLVIDSDDAGKKAPNGLIQRNINTFSLKANKDYHQLVIDIKWLTSV
jgi:hypothetical protein